MSALLVLLMFGEWIWVEASEHVNTGLEFTGGEASQVVLLDIDGDADEDLIAFVGGESPHAEGFENITDGEGARLWESDPGFVSGLDFSSGISSIASGDLNGDGVDELIVRDDAGLAGYVRTDGVWELDPGFFAEFEGDFPYYADFADVDDDGDADMLGGHHPYMADDDPVSMWWNTGNPDNPVWESDTTYFDYEYLYGPCGSFRWIDANNDGLWDVVFARGIPDVTEQSIDLLLNHGSATDPEWSDGSFGFVDTWHVIFEVNDWNADGVEDILLLHDEHHKEAYLYYPGHLTPEQDSYDFSHPFLWGGIHSAYPAVADLNDDDVPEMDISKIEYHWSWGEDELIPHIRSYSLVDGKGYMWHRTDEEQFWDLIQDSTFQPRPVHVQYVDFGNDGVTDRVWNLDGENILYRNVGTAGQAIWAKDEEALSSLPRLFPSCFIDIDGDRDNDVIGYLEDGTLTTYHNRSSDRDPHYGRYDRLMLGLEGLEASYFAAADLNEDGISDLAVGLSGGGLTAYSNYYGDKGYWIRNDVIFTDIPAGGNPCLFDADGDGDLDLYIVQDGILGYYRNESTSSIVDRQLPVFPRLCVVQRGSETEVCLTVDSPEEVELTVFNAAGQAVMESRQVPQDGKVSFRVAQSSGVFFCRIEQGGLLARTASFVLLK